MAVQSTVPDLAGIAYSSVHGLMLIGLVLIIVRPFFPGLAITTGAALVYYAGTSFVLQQVPGSWQIASLVAVLLFTFAGLFTSWWTEKLGFRYTHVTPEVVWGGFLGMIVAALLYMPLSIQIGGMFIGATLASFYVQKRSFKEAVQHGPVAIYSLLGPRGFQLLMTLLVCDTCQFLLHRVRFPVPGLR